MYRAWLITEVLRGNISPAASPGIRKSVVDLLTFWWDCWGCFDDPCPWTPGTFHSRVRTTRRRKPELLLSQHCLQLVCGCWLSFLSTYAAHNLTWHHPTSISQSSLQSFLDHTAQYIWCYYY